MGTSTPTTSDEYTCSECGVTFEDAATMQNHYFTEHLVTPSGESQAAGDVGDSNTTGTGDETTRSHQQPGRETGTDETTATESGSTSEASLLERLSDLILVLFVVVLLGIPVVALVLALV